MLKTQVAPHHFYTPQCGSCSCSCSSVRHH